MKLKIALSGYAGGESNLISLKNPVPNGDFHFFGLNPISHSPNNRRVNEQLAPKESEADAEEAPSTIKRRKKDFTALAEPEIGGTPANPSGKNMLPNGADMYYGLKPIEHNPIMRMDLGDAVCSSPIKLKG
jgi:hypothetical protein